MAEIKPFPNNPRKITEAKMLRLGETLAEYGDLSCIVINTTGKFKDCLVSGNQRAKHIDLSQIVIEKEYDKPNTAGTVKEGYVLHHGERFNVRFVKWTDKKCEIANLLANNSGGENDLEVLKMHFAQDVIELGGINIVFEEQKIEFLNEGLGNWQEENEYRKEPNNALYSEKQEDDLIEIDETQFDKSANSYLSSSIRQIVLYFDIETHKSVMDRLLDIGKQFGIDEDNSETVLKLIEFYDSKKD